MMHCRVYATYAGRRHRGCKRQHLASSSASSQAHVPMMTMRHVCLYTGDIHLRLTYTGYAHSGGVSVPAVTPAVTPAHAPAATLGTQRRVQTLELRVSPLHVPVVVPRRHPNGESRKPAWVRGKASFEFLTPVLAIAEAHQTTRRTVCMCTHGTIAPHILAPRSSYLSEKPHPRPCLTTMSASVTTGFATQRSSRISGSHSASEVRKHAIEGWQSPRCRPPLTRLSRQFRDKSKSPEPPLPKPPSAPSHTSGGASARPPRRCATRAGCASSRASPSSGAC